MSARPDAGAPVGGWPCGTCGALVARREFHASVTVLRCPACAAVTLGPRAAWPWEEEHAGLTLLAPEPPPDVLGA